MGDLVEIRDVSFGQRRTKCVSGPYDRTSWWAFQVIETTVKFFVSLDVGRELIKMVLPFSSHDLTDLALEVCIPSSLRQEGLRNILSAATL